MKQLTVPFAGVLLLCVACAAPPPPEKPAVDLAAERAAVETADKEWSASIQDVDKYMSFYADGAYFLGINQPMIVGKQGIRERIDYLNDLPGFGAEVSAVKVEVSKEGDMAYVVGKGQWGLAVEGGESVVVPGKTLTVWKKQADGSWKIVAEAINSAPMEEETEAEEQEEQ
jgi:ketosteroid isomerase-like protein